MTLLSLKEAAEKLGVSARRVNQLIDEGKLSAQKIGNSYVINEADLEKIKVYGKPGRPAKAKNDKGEWFKQIRIGIKLTGGVSKTETGNKSIELNRSQTNLSFDLQKIKPTLQSGNPALALKQGELDKVEKEIKDLNDQGVYLSMVENTDELPFNFVSNADLAMPFLIDTPPTKLKISAKGRGKYTVYVWEQ